MKKLSQVYIALLLAAPALGAQTPVERQAARWDSVATVVLPAVDRICATQRAPGYLCAEGAARDSLRAMANAGRADTLAAPTPPADTTVVVTPPPDTSAPPAVIFSHPFAPPANGAQVPELPRDTMGVAPLPVTRTVRCAGGLQLCVDTARVGDELRLPLGATVGPTVVRTSGITIRSDLSDAALGGLWKRLTPADATALNLATIASSSTTEPLQVANGVHDVQVVGLRVTTTASQSNALVRIGTATPDTAQLARNIVLRQIVADPGARGLQRCVVLDGYRLALISSTLANCHSYSGDSQGVLSIHGRGVFRVENNAIAGGHQCLLLGGGDPAIAGQVPSDIVFRRNDCTRPIAWKGVWQAKTLIELKLGERVLIEGNEVSHVYADAQAGYAFLIKTENQGGGNGDWSRTADVTIRYNHIVGAAAFVNLAPLVMGPGIPLTRVSIYGNVADSINVAPYTGDTGDGLLTQGVSDVIFRDNWVRNPTGRAAVYAAQVQPRFVGVGNVLGGHYGWKGEGTTFSSLIPDGLLSGNTTLPWGTAFSSWPAAPVNAARDSLLSGVSP